MVSKKCIVFIAVAIVVFLGYFWKMRSSFFVDSVHNTVQKVENYSQPKMTVFVHGSFGSLLGFLSFSNTLNDTVSGTLYRTITKKMRNDDFFYKDQPILQRGLVRVVPTFDLKDVGGRKFAVYPIAKSFQIVADLVSNGKEQNYFYTFGWSGLMSQNSRRFEAVRLYNALVEELDALRQQGVFPRVRLIAHSHGGNLCLNLAVINKVLKVSASSEKSIYSKNAEENEALQKMVATMADLTTRENAKSKQDQKTYDYVPEDASLSIDELVLFGVPIQPETELFCHSGFFKWVYNFYSNEDYVQRLDWVTSKKSLSNQRISGAIKATNGASHVIQARLFYEKPVHKGKMKVDAVPLRKEQKTEKVEKTVFEELVEGRNIFVRQSKDPTHKELWFMQWDEVQNSFITAITPLPVLVLTPLLLHALSQATDVSDADINIEADAQQLNVHIASYKQNTIKKTVRILRKAITALKPRVMAWKPEKISTQDEFNAVYKYVSP